MQQKVKGKNVYSEYILYDFIIAAMHNKKMS